ncbi:Lactose regulatory protein LAC9 [Fusarium oxysporum f. sp. albedinis]|nr:Lactose regulatory protein LAC9 [Fusarium oxysporum f. sp. albedinis]
MSSSDGAYFLPVQKTPYLANDPTIGQYINQPNPFLFLSAKDYLNGKGASILSSDHPGVDHKKFLTSQEAATIVFPSGRAQGHRNIFLRSIEATSKTLKRNIYGLRYPGFSIDKLDIPSPDPLTSVRTLASFGSTISARPPTSTLRVRATSEIAAQFTDFLKVTCSIGLKLQVCLGRCSI